MAVQQISVRVATAVGLGAIIGAGIFVLSGTTIALAGVYSIIAFVLVGAIATLVAVELGSLGEIMPHSKGAAYSFVYNAFGSEMGFVTGIMLYFSFATAVSAVALGFGAYLGSMLGLTQHIYAVAFALLQILALTIINIIGIKKAAKADFGLVVVKLGVLTIFILFALLFLMAHPHVLQTNFATIPSKEGLGAIFAASVAVFFAYTGFQTISTLTDRIKGGARGASKALMFSVFISIVVYLLVDISLMLLAPANAYTVNADPLSFALKYAAAPAWLFTLVDIGALVATTSAALAMILASSRTAYQISKDKLLPAVLRKYNPKRDVAINGVIITSAISAVMLFSGNIYIIAAISNFGLLFAYLMSSIAVIHFKRRPDVPLKIPFYPYLPIATILALVALLIGMPKEALLIGSGMIMLLIAVYYFFREIDRKKPVKVRLFK
ncbi:MAG: APC family permease [Candidatus Marsarchaeota archaeon]|nr:APC family permease [Candidatus Marsarchaeota archaeon]MCL5112292.1 APC family permease [Candidatus Marsarchaeota archaeon]